MAEQSGATTRTSWTLLGTILVYATFRVRGAISNKADRGIPASVFEDVGIDYRSPFDHRSVTPAWGAG